MESEKVVCVCVCACVRACVRVCGEVEVETKREAVVPNAQSALLLIVPYVSYQSNGFNDA